MSRGRDLQPGDEALTDFNGPGRLQNRPGVCRDYQPLSDPLCAEFVGPNPLSQPEHFAFPGVHG